jgi:hypothetical protein
MGRIMGLQPTTFAPMNSTILFPATEPTLKLTRPSTEKWAATLLEERRRLQEDQEALREREQNLRHYEARLRALQEEIEAGRGVSPAAPAASRSPLPARQTSQASRPPMGDDAALMSAWEKLHRARELLEAEQAHLRDDRHAMREQDAALKRREAAVVAREQQLAAREAIAQAQEAPPQPVAGEHTLGPVSRLTRVPFDMARSVFGGKK